MPSPAKKAREEGAAASSSPAPAPGPTTSPPPAPAASPSHDALAQLYSDRPQVAILDFGSQFSHLIARRVRELHVFCELYSCKVAVRGTLSKKRVVGVILSGGPSSVYDADAPHVDPEFWAWVAERQVPVLGICYGMQEMSWHYGGSVEPSPSREYGKAVLSADASCELFAGIAAAHENVVWMSHGDKVTKLPDGFTTVATSENSPHAAMASKPELPHKMFGIQFHPEVTHTVQGARMLRNFCVGACAAPTDWNMRDIASAFIDEVRAKVGPKGHVLGAVSGGVDSSVAAVLLNRAIGRRFHAVMVDNGCLRLNEGAQVVARLREKENIDLRLVDASERFLAQLADVTDPERKRKIIGNLFIDVFQEEAARIRESLPAGEHIEYLLQGTLYPDVIESISYKGPSATIKTHHNVGGLPEKMRLLLIEPLRELFKDEVRELGEALGLDHESVWRHPFPGPGLAIRVLADVTKQRADTLRQADDIMIQEIRKAGIYDSIAQAFVVLLPTVKSVGVMGDGRTYESVAVGASASPRAADPTGQLTRPRPPVRCVVTNDFMSADWYPMDPVVLGRISSRIINEVRGINRVCYDVSSKPPATIEWE